MASKRKSTSTSASSNTKKSKIPRIQVVEAPEVEYNVIVDSSDEEIEEEKMSKGSCSPKPRTGSRNPGKVKIDVKMKHVGGQVVKEEDEEEGECEFIGEPVPNSEARRRWPHHNPDKMVRGGSSQGTSSSQKKNRQLRDEDVGQDDLNFNTLLFPALPAPPSFYAESVPATSSSHTEGDGEEDNDLGSEQDTVGRGAARPISPLPDGQKLNCKVEEKYLEGTGVASFWTKQIQRHVMDFWPNYTDIDIQIREHIWNSFKERYHLVGFSEAHAKDLFHAHSATRWRDFLVKKKRACLAKVRAGICATLVEVPRQRWCTSPETWDKYLAYWSSPDVVARSEVASKNRLSPAGRPDGQIATHPYGARSLRQRISDHKKRTGEDVSPLTIISNIYRKKNKVTGEPIGEVYDRKVLDAVEQYDVAYKEIYGPDADPRKGPVMKNVWCGLEAVKGGLPKGRVLGVGSSSSASEVFVDTGAGSSSGATVEIEELRRKRDEDHAEMEVMKEMMAQQQRLLEDMKAQQQRELEEMKAMMNRFFQQQGPSQPSDPVPPYAGSFSTVESSTASDWIKNMEMARAAPAQFMISFIPPIATHGFHHSASHQTWPPTFMQGFSQFSQPFTSFYSQQFPPTTADLPPQPPPPRRDDGPPRQDDHTPQK